MMTASEFFQGSEYFTRWEFDSPDKVYSGNEMDVNFLLDLERARKIAGVPFRITSGYRTPSHNKKVGGVSDSAHTKGLAADIATPDDRARFMIHRALIGAGFTRIGVGYGFIHVDSDQSKNAEREWLYGSSPAPLQVKLSWFAKTWARLFKK